MKAIWKGSLSFGLINIPINVYPASEEHTLEFHMLHKKDLSPIRFARVCKEEEKEIPYSEIVKGFEYEKGRYVVIDDKDFKAANAKKTSTIEIKHFTDLLEIEPIYFAKPYFLEPDKKARKAYQLLNEALNKSKKVAIASFVFRNKEHIGAILASKEGLLLIEMRYFAEIRSFEELNIPKEKSSAKELEMALMFIDQSSQHFQPQKYHDTYMEELMQLIESKLKGKKGKIKRAEAPIREVEDLMSLLQASVKQQAESKAKHLPHSSTPKKRQPGRHAR